MGSRKKARRVPSGGNSTSPPVTISQASTTSQVSLPMSASTASSSRVPPPQPPQLEKQNGSTASAPEGHKKVTNKNSWYGSWPRKSVASTQLARETILGDNLKAGSTPDFSRYDTKKTSETASLRSLGVANQSTVTLPNIPETPKVLKEETKPIEGEGSKMAETTQKKTGNGSAEIEETTTGRSAGANADAVAVAPKLDQPAPETPQRPATASTWLGWFGKSAAPEVNTAETESSPPEPASPEPPKETEQQARQPTAQKPIQEAVQSSLTQRLTSGSLAYFWPAATTSESVSGGDIQAMEVTTQTPKDAEDAVMEDAPPAAPNPSAGSTWAFWSSDKPKSPGKTAETSETESGELAVMGDRSESHPKRANSIDMSETPTKPVVTKEVQGSGKSTKKKTTKKDKRLRPQAMDLDNETPGRPSTPQSDASSIKGADSSGSKTPLTAKSLPPNLLLPSFKNTYRMKDNPSIMRQIAQLLLRTQQSPVNHVFLSKDAPKIKKALAIGVHGLFPASFLRPMLGQPTGTSIRFANHCADGIRRWADSHGCEDCEIEKVALEGEGKIGERVENLWKLLLNWIDHIRSADLIILACHSQGVPVSVMLLAKLIEMGVISNAKIGVCAMAGVNLGPFPDYKSSMGIIMGSAAELWEFANPESEVSKRYEQSLKVILNHGVRITYVASIDDQLVPIESAIYSAANHPYIYRAIFIDGRIHAPDFIAHLVGFACKLRNLGISDHGLVRELSIPLAGSLYGGEGHSRLYGDSQVYDLAVAHALETTDVGNVPCEIQKYEGLTNPNPYHLPWIMRGLLEEDFVKTELSSETSELLKQFDEWKPVTKALKDVKYRLEVVRSKL